MDLCQQVEEFIQQAGLLSPNQHVVAGISGGPDSLCLMDCLHRLGYPLIVAHLDHQMRPESAEEAVFVKDMAEKYGLPYVSENRDVKTEATSGVSLEEAARLARYQFLVQVARAHEIEVIATGHNADDQVETVLMHLLRGAGPSGLRGMLPSTSLTTWSGLPEAEGIRLVRPLLLSVRDDIEAYCLAANLEPRMDSTNLDETFFRNRLRHHLLPLLETYNPGIRKVLIRMGRLMRGEAELLEAQVESHWARIVRQAGGNALALQIAPFIDLPEALQRAMLRTAIEKLKPHLRDIGFKTIERGMDYFTSDQMSGVQVLAGNLEMIGLGDEIVIKLAGAQVESPKWPQMNGEMSQPFLIPGEIHLANGWQLKSSSRQIAEEDARLWAVGLEGYGAAIDGDALSGPLILRSLNPGDRIQPLGMEGRTKVSTLFINEHIPRMIRARWPIVVCGEDVVWVAGLRMSNLFRLTDQTRKAVLLELIPPEEMEI